MLVARLFGISSANVILGVSRRKFSTDPSAQTGLCSKRTKGKRKRNVDNEPTVKTEWSEEQKRVISAVQDGKSVFISGSAGTGKTLLLKHIIKLLKKKYKPSGIYATATTGVAACALRGQTLHSFSGVGYLNPMGEREDFLARVMSNNRALKRWMKARALVIDEISMADGEFFDILERIARAVRGRDSPWGGIQLVASGDFFQLPPVFGRDVPGDAKEFAFEADCWGSSFELQVELERVYRQTDPKLVELLQGIRRGECDVDGLRMIVRRNFSRSVPDSSVVELYPRNRDVMRVNEERLRSLNKDVFVYRAVDTGKGPWMRELGKGIAPDEISLCEGARVMLIKNLNTRQKLVNGSTGTVVGFREAEMGVDKDFRAVCWDGLVPEVEFDHGATLVIEPETWAVEEGDKVVAERKQIPLILAWSVSIHKCQGMTLDRLRTNLSHAFGFGMVYVALSRVRSLDGLYLSGFSPSKIKAHPKVVQFYEKLARERDQDGGDDVSEQKEDIETGRSSNVGLKFHFSLSEYLLSRQLK